MKLLKNKESGQVLIMALILLAAGSLLVIPLLKQSFTNVEYHQSIECRTLTNYTADSGVEYVLAKLYGNPGVYTEIPLQWNGTRNGTLNDRTLDVSADYQGNGIFLVTSTASGGGCSTTITAYINLGAGSFAYAIAAKNLIRLENMTVNSDLAGHGDIRSTEHIDLRGGNVTVNGSASAHTITIETPPEEARVTNGVYRDASPIMFPGDYSGLYESLAKEGGTWPETGTGVWQRSGGTHSLGPLYINGDLIIDANTIVILGGTVYVTGNIEVHNARFEGEENVVAGGTITISGGAIGSENLPLFTSVDGDIILEGTEVHAVVYAPEGTVWVSGGVSLFGAVGGSTVEVSNATIIYAQSLQGRDDLPGGLLYTISYSYD